jgi:hypothetical protein
MALGDWQQSSQSAWAKSWPSVPQRVGDFQGVGDFLGKVAKKNEADFSKMRVFGPLWERKMGPSEKADPENLPETK